MSHKQGNISIFSVVLSYFYHQTASHNPEVVGSSPASATIKTTVFTMKTVVFLTFGAKMETPKLSLVLVTKSAQMKN